MTPPTAPLPLSMSLPGSLTLSLPGSGGAPPLLGDPSQLAHVPAGPSELWTDWHPDPLVVAGLALLAVAYRQGRALRRRSAGSRGELAAFAGALVTLAVALVSPLDGAAAALFSAHMVQHLLLVVVAAPLLVVARTGGTTLRALPHPLRRRVRGLTARRPARRLADLMTHPLAVWGLGTAVLWVWHLPAPYEAALAHDAVHALEHLTLLATAVLLWVAVLGRPRHRVTVPVAALVLFATGLQGSALGAVLVFAQRPLYAVHQPTAPQWGLTALEDQQLAGGLMWVPPGLVYLAVTVALVVRWFDALGAADAPPAGAGPVGAADPGDAAAPPGGPHVTAVGARPGGRS